MNDAAKTAYRAEQSRISNLSAADRKAASEAQGYSGNGARAAGEVPAIPTTDSAPTGPQRDYEAEKNTLATIGKKPANEQDLLNMAIMTYGDTLPSEFEAIRLRQEAAAQAGDAEALALAGQDLSAAGQDANAYAADVATQAGQLPGNLKVLQDALKMSSGVGNQALGTSEIFEDAEVTGYGALASSLAARDTEMSQRYESYANLVSKMTANQYAANTAQAAKAQQALDNYAQLMDSYKFESARLDQKSQRLEDWGHQLELLDRQHQNTLEELSFKADQESAGALSWKDYFGEGSGDTYTSADGTIYVAPGYNSGGESTVITDSDPYAYQKNSMGEENRFNCVTYARNFVPNLPRGLWSIRDKANVVDPNIKEPQIGDAMLTAEGAYGHATVVTAYDPETRTITVQEANYKAGVVTTGRTLTLGDGVILGFVRPDQSKVVAENGAQALIGQLGEANKDGKFMENLTANVMANKYEGMNPQGAETYMPTAAYDNFDLASAYANTLTAKGIPMTEADPEVQALLMNYLARGDVEGAKQQILNTAMNGLTAAEKTDVRARLALVAGLTDAKEKIKVYEAGGGDMNIFTGNITKIIERLGTTDDEALSSVGSTFQLLMDEYIRMQTGAALTGSEEKFYKQLFPTSTVTGDFATTRIDTLVGAMNIKNKSTVGSTMGVDLYDKIFSPETIRSELGFSDDTASATDSALSNFFSY